MVVLCSTLSRFFSLRRGQPHASGVLHGCCILTDGTVTVFGPMQDSLHQVPFAARDPAFPVTQLSVGRSLYTSYGVALRSDGVVVCWGDGPALGPSPDPVRPFVRVAARVGGGVALRSDGSITGWGTSQLSSFPACMGTVHFPVREFAYGAGVAVALVPATDCNLDGATGRQVMDLLFEVARTDNTTLILITHDMGLAERCDRVLRIADGLLVADDRMPSVLAAQ
jgi:alpha-tubulin suppressor-like RCC1 family protein